MEDLGLVAYGAYQEALWGHKVAPWKWDALEPEIRERWRAAGAAVESRVRGDLVAVDEEASS